LPDVNDQNQHNQSKTDSFEPLFHFKQLHENKAYLLKISSCDLYPFPLSSQTILFTNTQSTMSDKSEKSEKSEKLKALQLTIDKLEKSYGKGAVMRLSDEKVVDLPSISTGSLGLDIALGIGGIPRGRVVEIYGPESSGKTTLTLHCIAEAQKKGGLAAFIDAEHAFDKAYAEKLGIDTENLLISQPDNGEQALEIAEHLIRSGAIDIIVIDSVAALVPKAELEGEMGDSKMGLQARLMSQALRKLTGAISKTGCCCIFINQLREKIGVMFGNPETTTGGNALKFYASVRLDIRRIGQIKESADNILGNRTRVKVVKNKVAPPFKVVEFDIMYGLGISKSGEIVDLGVELNIIKKAGSWFSYNGEKLGQGRDTVKSLLEDNPELMEELELKIKARVNGTEVAEVIAE
jgi:recombination protein RecA